MNRIIAVVLAMGLSSAFAAVEVKPEECRQTRVVNSIQEIETELPNRIQWHCLNLSRIGKGDLLTIAGKVPSMTLSLSQTKLSWLDLVEVQGRTKVNVVVDSRRVNKREIMAMQDAGIAVTIRTFGLVMSSRDYDEIAQNGPVNIEVGSRVFTKQNLIDLGKRPTAKLSIEPKTSGMSMADIAEIIGSVSKETPMEDPTSGKTSPETK